jgi:transposase
MDVLPAQAASIPEKGLHSEMSYKQLQQGAFRWPLIMDGTMKLSAAAFAALFDGLDWTRIQTTKTFTNRPSLPKIRAMPNVRDELTNLP